MPIKGSRIDGKHGIYELGDELGHGGNGTVFDVRIVDRKDDWLSEKQETVIKILTISHIKNEEERKKRRERFQREVNAVRKVIDVCNIIAGEKGVSESFAFALEYALGVS